MFLNVFKGFETDTCYCCVPCLPSHIEYHLIALAEGDSEQLLKSTTPSQMSAGRRLRAESYSAFAVSERKFVNMMHLEGTVLGH